jgi:acyl-CoA reductase-like NAD-dependent aldehyde dehydrogenase
VRKTYKLFIGGAFPRSESGRSYPVRSAGGELLAYAARASRKDARDAVRAARGAFAGWSGATAYNRGQVLYRVAELMEGRAAQFAAEISAAEGLPIRNWAAAPSAAPDPAVAPAAAENPAAAGAAALSGSAAFPAPAGGLTAADEVAAAIDRWVWYAGWTDKVAAVAGSANPVAGPYFNFSVPEPTGVVAVLAPPDSSLLGLVSVLAPVIATGNTAVVVTSGARPLPAITLAEVLATSDVPAGVVNLLTGDPAELAPVLAGHQDVDAIDLTGAPPGSAADLEALAAGNLKRVFRGRDGVPEPDPESPDEDWRGVPGTRRLLAFLEVKTVWHPAGI